VVDHLAVAVLAAVVTAVLAPLVAMVARRLGVVSRPPEPWRRREVAVPTLGGIAMAAGALLALGLATVLPTFSDLFASTSEPLALLVGVLVITAIGIVDDVHPLPPPVKLAGQIVAALGVVLFGVQLVHFWVPGLEVVALSSDLGLVLTVLALVAMINAVNLIDGLDGLAAGVAAIAAIAFFAFAVRSQPSGLTPAIPTSSTLVVAIVLGVSLGFLVHNWHPARLYMGDTGSQLLGLLLGVAMISHVGRTAAPTRTDFVGSIPLLVPVLVLAVPFLDTAFAVVRRLVARRPVTAGDRGHLHHLLLAFGHSHRRAVLILYYWSAAVAFGSVGPSFLPAERLVPWLLVAGAIGLVLTALSSRDRPAAAADAPREAERPRSDRQAR
jgi:UDP-GlcNAc:undecaprenyl-phosphate/decaprenyl-phosphate GlcNAc-1-phosphate transferase